MSEETIANSNDEVNIGEISGKVDINLTSMPKLIPIEEMEICTPPVTVEEETTQLTTIKPDLRTFNGLVSNSCSLVRCLYIFPDSCDSETNYIVLIQDDCISIWWREDNSTKHWLVADHTIENEPSIVEGSSIETEQFIWIVLAYDGTKELNLIHLKFDKITKEIKLHLRELFSMTFISCEMMHKCQTFIKITCLPKEKSALSLPGPSSTIRLFLYDLPTSRKTLLTALKKDASLNHLYPVDDWDNVLIALYDHQIQLWNTTDKSIINSVLVDKSVFRNKFCFNVLHDKGLVHLFLGDSRSSAIEVIALNPKTGRYATLMSCKLFDSEVTSTSTTSTTDTTTTNSDTITATNQVNINKIKRSGDQLLVIKDDGLIVYDLANNKLVLNCDQGSIADSSIGFVNDVAVIFAATLNGKVINLLNT
ncbi:uncharacterized protein LOC128385635 [Panonychus citri]|uniref:uncharacterized protein LOC128385635 n=1 Tax=Panonychus citri TaxID=50023 RepID=UPI002307A639|nr:uncharacterized protein LOC128385635 [Panonychus citri]